MFQSPPTRKSTSQGLLTVLLRLCPGDQAQTSPPQRAMDLECSHVFQNVCGMCCSNKPNIYRETTLITISKQYAKQKIITFISFYIYLSICIYIYIYLSKLLETLMTSIWSCHPSIQGIQGIQGTSLACKIPWWYLWAWGIHMGHGYTMYPQKWSNSSWGKWWLTMIHYQLLEYSRKTNMLWYKPKVVYAFQQAFQQILTCQKQS